MITEIQEYFPESVFNVYEEDNQENAKSRLQSKSSSCWGQGKVGDTGYFKLESWSPRSQSDKRNVLVCKCALIE
jgi:hypothetical protein